jgi:hypothetical protein
MEPWVVVAGNRRQPGSVRQLRQASRNRCRRLPPLAEKTTWEGGRRQFEPVRGLPRMDSDAALAEGLSAALPSCALLGLDTTVSSAAPSIPATPATRPLSALGE